MILDAIAFPTIFFSSSLPDGFLKSNGSLFELQRDIMSEAQLLYYAGLKKTGWSRCPKNYDVYARQIAAEDTGLGEHGVLVLPGLRTKGSPRANEKMIGVQAHVDKGYVVRHVDQVIATTQELANRFDQITRQNIHEIKGINTGIYHAALRLADLSRGAGRATENSLAGNISALSQILTARTDYMTFLADSSLDNVEFCPAHVYRTFDRMRKCFADRASNSKVSIVMAGAGTFRTYGPKNLLDVAAYILVDNAVKYSPPNGRIIVRVNDGEKNSSVCIESVGPLLQDDDARRIFEKGYRSQSARALGVTGTGIGLHALKSVILPAFGGEMDVQSGAWSHKSGEIEFGPISFRLTLPLLV